ncbi:MAG: serine hydrolase domain-containing protein [Caulobacteraceae bacterium]
MTWLRVLACAMALAVAPAAAQAPAQAPDIDGLWAARMRYGPDVRGPLLIERRGDRLVAEIAGRQIDVRNENGELRFDLASDIGTFRGRVAGREREIRGHWIQPRSNAGGGQRYATPVTLTRTRSGAWRGEVAPLDDVMSMYLPITTDAQGVMRAHLRNPERNIGAFVQVQRIERSGDRLRLITRFRGRGEEQAVAEGEYDHNNDLIPFHFAQFGVTMDFLQADAEAERVFYPRGREPAPYVYAQPPALDDGWRTGTLAEAGIDQEQLASFIEVLTHEPMTTLSSPQIHAVAIARHGRLVLEEYFHGFSRDQLHETRSAAKSMTAIMIGAAMQNGARFTSSSPVVDIVDPALLPATIDPRMRAMRLEHLLTMSPGFDCNDDDPESPGNEDAMQEQQQEDDFWRFGLSVPMARNPGELAIYCSMVPNLTGAVLAHDGGRWGAEQFAEQVAEPLGIRRYALNLARNGELYLGGGQQYSLRDFLKMGQLVLDGGVWNGRRVLSRDYVTRMTAPQTQIGELNYGYFWWGIDFPYQGRTVRAVYAGGNGGQVVLAIPELDLVIAFFGANYADAATFTSQRVYAPQYILPAVR